MSLALSKTLVEWMVSKGVVDARASPELGSEGSMESLLFNISGNEMSMSTSSSAKVENGIVVGKLILAMKEASAIPNLAKRFGNLQNDSSTSTRMYNWNILTPVLETLGIPIGPQNKVRGQS